MIYNISIYANGSLLLVYYSVNLRPRYFAFPQELPSSNFMTLLDNYINTPVDFYPEQNTCTYLCFTLKAAPHCELLTLLHFVLFLRWLHWKWIGSNNLYKNSISILLQHWMYYLKPYFKGKKDILGFLKIGQIKRKPDIQEGDASLFLNPHIFRKHGSLSILYLSNKCAFNYCFSY